jgi:hypothetical protein
MQDKIMLDYGDFSYPSTGLEKDILLVVHLECGRYYSLLGSKEKEEVDIAVNEILKEARKKYFILNMPI